jgi:hypothetical protein
MLRYIALGLLLVVGVSATAEPRPTARLVGRTPPLVANRPWTATMRLTPPARAPKLIARTGARIVRFPARRVGRDVYRVVVRLPEGTWRLFAHTGSHRLPLGVVRVAPATLGLDQPAQILVAPDGSILIAERGLRDRIVRVDPTTGVVTAFATGLSDPFGLAFGEDGSMLVSAGGAIHRLPASGGRPVEHARVDAGPIARAANGDIYYANRSELGVVRAGAPSPQVLPVRVNAPHALVLDGDSLFVADSGNGRILRVDLVSRQATVVAVNLRAPLALAAADRDEFLTAEYAAGTVLRVSRAGVMQPLAAGLARPYALAVAGDAVYVVEAGDLGRPTGAIKRVLRDGSVQALRLRRP